jgi:hypothetical protein
MIQWRIIGPNGEQGFSSNMDQRLNYRGVGSANLMSYFFPDPGSVSKQPLEGQVGPLSVGHPGFVLRCKSRIRLTTLPAHWAFGSRWLADGFFCRGDG